MFIIFTFILVHDQNHDHSDQNHWFWTYLCEVGSIKKIFRIRGQPAQLDFGKPYLSVIRNWRLHAPYYHAASCRGLTVYMYTLLDMFLCLCRCIVYMYGYIFWSCMYTLREIIEPMGNIIQSIRNFAQNVLMEECCAFFWILIYFSSLTE